MNETVQLWQYTWMQQGRSGDTLRTMTSELLRFEGWLSRPLMTATQGDCLGYLTFRRESVSKHAAEMGWRTLRSFYAFLSAEDGCPNPMERIKCPKRDEPAVTGVSEADFKTLLGVCKGTRAYDVRDRAIISLMWATGLRRAEVANLTTDDVDLTARVLMVRKSKTGKPRFVPFDNDAHAALLRWMRARAKLPDVSSPMLWLGHRGVMGNDAIRLMLWRRSKAAGVKVNAHQFRRTFAVSWLSNGGSQTSLQSLCGWSTGAMVTRYTKHAAGQLAESEYRRLYK